MFPLILIFIMSILLLSFLIVYALIYYRENSKSSLIVESQRLTYTTQPSINVVTETLEYSSSNSKHHHSSNVDLNKSKFNELRSYSITNGLFITKCSNRRRSSIIDSKQIAQIQFSLPPTAEKFRRRSVAICNNIIEPKQSTIDSIVQTIKSSNQCLPCLASFSMVYCNESSQIKLYFHSLISLSSTIQLQQLTIEVKLIPDGKVKRCSIKNITHNENIFSQDDTDYRIQFSNISLAKLHSKAILMKFYGKDLTNKRIQLGQIGKIHLNQIHHFECGSSINFIHEIEMIKISSIEILVSLEQNIDNYLTVGIHRVKGFKIEQKNSAATCYFQVTLLDRHRPLSTHQTKYYRLNASSFSLNELFDLNILAFNLNNHNRIMIMINLYSNANNASEHRCIARIKLAAPYSCSGSGALHWQQFKEQHSSSMWHKLVKH